MARSGIALVSSVALHALACLVALDPMAPVACVPVALEVTMTVVAPPPLVAPAPAPPIAPRAPVAAPTRARPRRSPVVADDSPPSTSDPVLDAASTFAIASNAAALRGLFASGLGEGDGAGDGDGAGRVDGDGSAASLCPDPATGVWTARFHWRSLEAWSFVTLEIARDGDQLAGEIRLHDWTGDTLPDEDARTDAPRENHRRTPAAGSVVGDHMHFAAHAAGVIRSSPDRFHGRLVPEENRFDAIWNDDLRVHDARIRFHRVRCAS